MKNRYLVIIILFLVPVIILAAAPVKAAEVSLVINEEPVTQELKLINGRTLIPAELIPDYLGGRLEANPEEKKLKVITSDLNIKFKAGSRIALVNSEVMPLTSPPCLIDGKFFLALRSLKKIYGGSLVWEPKQKQIYYNSNQVTEVKVSEKKSEVEIIVGIDSKPDYEVDLLSKPQRLVLDLKGTNLAGLKNQIPVNNPAVKQVRISQFAVDPAVVRLVIDLDKFSSYKVEERTERLVVKIKNRPGVVTSSIIARQANRIKRRPKIVIDPGHGGHDPGAIGVSGVEEKDVNLEISKKIFRLLKKQGYQVLLTRNRDEFIPLSRRAQLANEWSADIFISVHANFNYKPRINGTATYAHWYSSKQNWALAWYIQSELVKNIKLKDNGLKAANFVVLRETDMPAILLETAFLSNPREEELLISGKFQNKAVTGIAAGIEKYLANR